MDQENQAVRPIMIHRALLGSLERFMGVLIEHYAGAFPLWLAPVQAIVLPIADRHAPYAEQVREELEKAGFRVKVDTRNEKTGYKIREAQLQKIPYMLIVGDREVESGGVSVRSRDEGDLGSRPLAEFVGMAREALNP
jgi:threonyl-tRNA synthetase